ncbi:MAG: 4Fe-4S binding protein [Candidatus Bathyarchaeia archaeon]
MVRVLLRFNKEKVNQPITSEVILEQNTHINILSASVNQLGGEILTEMPDASASSIIDAFRKRGIIVDTSILIEKDNDRCIDCGACISLCPMEALQLEEHEVTLDSRRCTGKTCALCIDACPREALHIIG